MSWIGEINITKMNILYRAIYKFNIISIKVLPILLKRMEEKLKMFIWYKKAGRIAKAILRKKSKTVKYYTNLASSMLFIVLLLQ